MNRKIRIGTRGSQLALHQTGMVVQALRAVDAGTALDIEIVEITTSGDWRPEQGETRLAEAQGGKGLFAKEIERALLEGHIDCGVHSAKDMPSFLPEGLVLNHVLPRTDPRDALCAVSAASLEELPPGAVVGTSSLRRQAFVLTRRPDLKVVPLRGNVPTRLEKMDAGQVDAAILAVAGLKRLGLGDRIASVFSVDDMLPAAAQGIVAIETRADDKDLHNILSGIHCRATGLQLIAERAVLQVLDGSCRSPLAAYAALENGRMHLRAAAAWEDGRAVFEESVCADVATDKQAQALGQAVGAALKKRVPPEILQGP